MVWDEDKDALILKTDCLGKTCLHYAQTKELAELYLSVITPDYRDRLLLCRDNTQKTALHCARDADVATLLIDYAPLENTFAYLSSVDDCDRTVLHYTRHPQVIDDLRDAIPASNWQQFVLIADRDKHIAAFYMEPPCVDRLLKVSEGIGPDIVRSILGHQDGAGDTLYHYCGQVGAVDVYNVLECWLEYMELNMIRKPDSEGNIITYMTAGQRVKPLAEVLRRFSQIQCREIIFHENKLEKNSVLIALMEPRDLKKQFYSYIQRRKAPDWYRCLDELRTRADEVPRLLHMFSNQYSLVSPGSIISHSLGGEECRRATPIHKQAKLCCRHHSDSQPTVRCVPAILSPYVCLYMSASIRLPLYVCPRYLAHSLCCLFQVEISVDKETDLSAVLRDLDGNVSFVLTMVSDTDDCPCMSCLARVQELLQTVNQPQLHGIPKVSDPPLPLLY